MDIKFEIDEQQKEIDKLEGNNLEGNNKKKKKLKKVKTPKTPLEKAAKVFLILSIIAVFILINASLSPALTGLLGVVLFLIWFAVAAVFTIVSIGSIWAIEGFRSFNEKFMKTWQTIFEQPEKIATTMQKLMPIFASVCGAIVLTFFILALIAFIKNKKKNTVFFVFGIIFLVLAILFIAIGFYLAYNINK